MRTVNVLGTEYTIETHKTSENEYLKEKKLSGYCGEFSKTIVIADMSEKEFYGDMDENEQENYRKGVLRHEIVHAFFNESGLSGSSNVFGDAWTKNEELVDWIAIQSPKMLKAFEEAGAL